MKRVVLLSVHCYEAPQRAGFHWLADAYWEDGWDVTFVTASLSNVSRLRRDRRMRLCGREDRNRLRCIRPRLSTFTLFTAIHPVNLRSTFLNRIARPLMQGYGRSSLGELEPALREADLIVFESSACLLFARRIRELNPRARLVYRASDDLRFNGNHPLVLEEEQRALAAFDLISAPSPAIYDRFSHVDQAKLQYHGIDQKALERHTANPYGEDGLANAVFVGVSRADLEFFRLAPAAAPEWRLHVIGPILHLPDHPRLTAHGLLPFEGTVPFIQHADAGLHTLAYSEGVEAFSDSLKALQYTYCRLPVIAPEFLRSRRNNGVYYRPGDRESISKAFAAARAMDRAAIDASCIRSVGELAGELAGE